MNKPRGTTKDQVLSLFSIPKEGGLVSEDQISIGNQRGLIVQIIKEVAACLYKGKGIVGLSLPILIFEPRSTIERSLDRWGYLPMFMATAAGCNDRVERMKYVISMAVAGLHLSNSQGKPFNPLLGETCEAYWPDGS